MAAYQQFLQGPCVVEMLFIGIDCYRDSPLDSKMGNSVEGIISATTTTDD
jgi:hypothetical protein